MVALGAADLRRVGIFVICLILAVGIHEFAHAYAAHRLGDPTPEGQGRLTLNPVAHMDPVGTLALPLSLGLFVPGLMFGWGRPVECQPRLFTRKISMRAGMALVAFAGPLSNLLQALVTLAIIFGLTQAGVLEPAAVLAGTEHPITLFFYLNIVLFAFNLLPLHPLDGGKVLYGIMGPRYQPIDDFIAKWGMFIILGLVLAPSLLNIDVLGALFGPLIDVGSWALRHVV